MRVITPSRLSWFAIVSALLFVQGTAAFLALQYSALPDLLPVHFRRGSGIPDGWQYKTVARVMVPAFVQLALSLSLGSIAALLLSRQTTRDDPDKPDVRAASAAAETVLLIALIWISFQAYAAASLVHMWTTGSRLGRAYNASELAGLLLTIVVAVRGYRRIGRPVARPFVAAHWRLTHLYKNADDPALFVPTRDGTKWTLNFGRPVAAALLGVVLTIGVLAPTAILIAALRYRF
jgi:uncharacterized membrane protein